VLLLLLLLLVLLMVQGPVLVREPVSQAEKQEVEAWKAARRSNYPTAANVAKKVKEGARRLGRGVWGGCWRPWARAGGRGGGVKRAGALCRVQGVVSCAEEDWG
jgi:hypothetical protein